MTDTTNLKENVLMEKFHQMKNKYLGLKSTNKNLVEAIELLNQRLFKMDYQRCKLIKMCAKILGQKSKKIQSLQRENNHVQAAIQDQNELIEEHLKTIEELRKEVNFLKEKNEGRNNKCNKKKNLNASETIGHMSNQSQQIKDPINFNNNLHNLTHPSFMSEIKSKKKNRKKVEIIDHSRWSNLNITVNRENNRNNNSFPDENNSDLQKTKKIKKLYCSVDEMVDLENEDY